MATLLLPDFIADLQKNPAPHFARRVLQKTLQSNGSFRHDSDDHRHHGVTNAWIRYVSAGRSAYRVVYIRDLDKIHLYRAGEHSVEDNLSAPKQTSFDSAVSVGEAGPEVAAAMTAISTIDAPQVASSPPSRLRRNVPTPAIGRAILSRRNLPHKDIWLVSPFVNRSLFARTAKLGRLILDQVEDGARVVLVTRPPTDQNIQWMEALQEQSVHVVVYPRLHAKLYCFVFDDDRRRERGLRSGDRYSSLILLGSANLTAAGQVIEEVRLAEHDPENGPVSMDFLDEHDIVEEVLGDAGGL
ncbi:MAG: hypothetical protein OXU77_20150 [Gammaproteobacteria bacterium]|nr:hypothetical protein [Gammaproteobacteria bacterium]